jgi:hypothetical protein
MANTEKMDHGAILIGAKRTFLAERSGDRGESGGRVDLVLE